MSKLVKPEDFVGVLTEEPIISVADIDFFMKHSADWKGQIEYLSRKRTAERLAAAVNDLVEAGEDSADFYRQREGRYEKLFERLMDFIAAMRLGAVRSKEAGKVVEAEMFHRFAVSLERLLADHVVGCFMEAHGEMPGEGRGYRHD